MRRTWHNIYRHDQAQVRRPPPGTVYLGTPAPEESSSGAGPLDLPAADPTRSENVRQAEE
jgi:hypothetical protein